MPPTRPWLSTELLDDVSGLDFRDQLTDALSSLDFQAALPKALDGLKQIHESFQPAPLPIVLSPRPSTPVLAATRSTDANGTPETPTAPGATPEPEQPAAQTLQNGNDLGQNEFNTRSAGGDVVGADPDLPNLPAARPSPQGPTEPIPQLAPAPQAGGDLHAYARAAAQKYGVDPDIFERQIQQESGFQPFERDGVTPRRSGAGAQGIAQFMPDTAKGYGVNVADPYSSLDGAARHMRDNLKANHGDYRFALAAYNAGQGNVDKYGEGVFGADFAHGQTRDYVNIILGPGAARPTAGSAPAAPPVAPAAAAPQQPAAGASPLAYKAMSGQPEAMPEQASADSTWTHPEPLGPKPPPARDIQPLAPLLRSDSGPLYLDPGTRNRVVAGTVDEWAEPGPPLPAASPDARNRAVPGEAPPPEMGGPNWQDAPAQRGYGTIAYRQPLNGTSVSDLPDDPRDADQGAPERASSPNLPGQIGKTPPELQSTSTYNDPTDQGTQSTPLPTPVPAAPVRYNPYGIPSDPTDAAVRGTTPDQPPAPTSPTSTMLPVWDENGEQVGWRRQSPQTRASAQQSADVGPVQAQPGEPDYVPPPRGALQQASEAADTYLPPAGGAPEDLARLNQIAQQAARWTGRASDPNERIVHRAPDDPAWRAAFPDLAQEYDDLQTRLGLVVGGTVGDSHVVRRTTEAIASGGRGLGTRIGEGIAEGRRTAAELNAADPGGTVLPGTLGVITGNPLEAARAARGRVVPPAVADTLDFPIRVPDDPAVVRAIEAVGGSVDPAKGVDLYVTRAQSPEGAGAVATRGGVFYEAVPEGGRSSYVGGDDVKGVGGSEVIPRTPTRFRSPLILSDAPGEMRGFNQGMEQLGVQRPSASASEISAAQQRVDEALTQYQRALDLPAGQTVHGMGAQLHRLNLEDAQKALAALKGGAVRSGDIDAGIRAARRTGPEGSPERAAALKDLVTKYGGDPALIDDLLRIRGADASESAWAIKENILAANARRAGYDGVVTVQPHGPDEALVSKHPKVVVAAQAVDEASNAAERAADAHQAAYERAIPAQFVRRSGESINDWYERVHGPAGARNSAYDHAIFRAQEHPTVLAAQREAERATDALKTAEDAYIQALDAARAEHPTHKITELADVREGRNPTPATQGEAWHAAQAKVTEIDARVDAATQAMDRAEIWGTPDEWKAARKAWGEARRELDAAVDAREALRAEAPGYTLREDVPRRAGSTDANATAGTLPRSAVPTDRLGAVNRVLGQGVASSVSGGASAAVADQLGDPNDPNRQAKAFLAGAAVPVLGPRGARAVARLAGKGAEEASGALSTLGNVPPSKVNQGMLPGLNPLQGPKPGPVELPASFPPAVERALTSAQRRAENMQAKGLTKPSVWDWIKQAGYAGIYGPATFMSSVAGGAQELVLGQPKEAIRALVAGRPGSYGAQVRGQLRALPEGVAGLGRVLYGADPAMTAAASGGSRGTAALSERLVNPVEHLAGRLLERPGEVLTEAPDAVFRPVFVAQGIEREARTIAAERGLRGSGAAAYADQLVADAHAVGAGALPVLPGTQRVLDAAKAYADELGYKGDPGGLGHWLGQMAKRDDAIGVLATFLVPFPSMSSRMSRAALRSTPGVGLLPAIRKGQPTTFDVVYDQAFGTALAAGVTYWAASGGITGSGPADQKQRQDMIDQGWAPNSVLVAGHYIPNRLFQRFQPILDTAGEIHDALAYGKPDAKPGALATDLVKRATRVATDQIGLSGLADLHDMLAGGFAAQFPGWAARSGLRYVPGAGILRAVAASQDVSPRKADSWGDVGLQEALREQASTAVPGLRASVPAVQDQLGRPAPNPQQGLGAIVPRVTTQRDDPTIRVFQQAGVAISSPPDTVTFAGAPLTVTPDEQRRWNTLRGEALIRGVAPYTRSDALGRLPPGMAEKILRQQLDQAGNQADLKLVAEMAPQDRAKRLQDALKLKYQPKAS